MTKSNPHISDEETRHRMGRGLPRVTQGEYRVCESSGRLPEGGVIQAIS